MYQQCITCIRKNVLNIKNLLPRYIFTVEFFKMNLIFHFWYLKMIDSYHPRQEKVWAISNERKLINISEHDIEKNLTEKRKEKDVKSPKISNDLIVSTYDQYANSTANLMWKWVTILLQKKAFLLHFYRTLTKKWILLILAWSHCWKRSLQHF